MQKAFLYPGEFQRIMELASEKQEFTFQTLTNTGARIDEARHIEFIDIDETRNAILIRKTKVRAKLKESRPRPRPIAISKQFCKYYRKNIKKYKILSTNQTGLLLKKYGKEVNARYWKDLSAHNLRKTFATWMLALNVDGFKLAQHLGHSPEMLRTHYASADIFNSDDKDRMREILGDLPSRLRGEYY